MKLQKTIARSHNLFFFAFFFLNNYTLSVGKGYQNLCADNMDAILFISIKSNMTVLWICIKYLQMHLQLCEKNGADMAHKKAVYDYYFKRHSIFHSMFVL